MIKGYNRRRPVSLSIVLQAMTKFQFLQWVVAGERTICPPESDAIDFSGFSTVGKVSLGIGNPME